MRSWRAFKPGNWLPRRKDKPQNTNTPRIASPTFLHLKLEITPDFKTRTLRGTATLDFQPIAKPLKQWRLNAVELNVQKVTSTHAIQATQSTDKFLEIASPAARSMRCGARTIPFTSDLSCGT